jgi:signal-transduction protein with cAMP-binding, CBS, and nucleotidyltransferase domain
MLSFRVRDWMVDMLVHIDPDATVQEAISLMRRRYINGLLVNKTETNPEWGIITSTDIVDKIIAVDRNPSKTKVREIMNSPIMTIDQEKTLQECVLFMKEHNVHHLPVTNSKGEMVGLISGSDFLVAAEKMGQQ